ncbi:hypothetical protein VP01_311g6 [Puccinia sorghi]|uniref:Uncharacterized protein n=1 Tax=Puccinia sorghi TaxID=27349 RepID=A0A0L6UZ89_9BASI|nr:hypothetical protein VP01_311g6 [Puccinia sorghi]
MNCLQILLLRSKPKSNLLLERLQKPCIWIFLAYEKSCTQLTNLATAHLSLVIAYPHLKGRALPMGGSPMGQAFLDMFEEYPNPGGTFLEFVNGKAALKKVSGKELPLPQRKRKFANVPTFQEYLKHDRGDTRNNLEAIWEQLGSALCECGWPGTKTAWRLAKLGIKLRIQWNDIKFSPEELCVRPANMSIGKIQCVLTELGEGWIELLADPARR